MSYSDQQFIRAQNFIVGGVNSPVRAFKAVGGAPRFMEKGEGAFVFDIDGKKYIDLVGGFGPMIVGHGNSYVLERITSVLKKGFCFGAPTLLETELAEKITARVKSVELIRFCNSGTEATMSAIRLARGYTKRDKLLKFAGCYHGHSDCLLVEAGSGALTLGVPSSAGVVGDYAKHTLTASYNDLAEVKRIFSEFGEQIAGVIVEPVAGNMNCVLPKEGFLRGLRDLCDQYGALLIFDEVMTGFRVARAGAQELFNVVPDLSCFGKVIGGGMPVGAFGGKAEIMERLAPIGDVYQAGTLSGNPVAMAAGIATLELTDDVNFYQDLKNKTSYLVNKINCLAEKHGQKLVINWVCGMLGVFFSDLAKITDFAQAKSSDTAKFARFFHLMLEKGVYLAPSAFEAIFIGLSHSYELLDQLADAFDWAFDRLN